MKWPGWLRHYQDKYARWRQIREIMEKPYLYELSGNPQDGWFICVMELPGCMSQGDTPQHAWDMIREAMWLWLDVSLQDGLPIPEPQEWREE